MPGHEDSPGLTSQPAYADRSPRARHQILDDAARVGDLAVDTGIALVQSQLAASDSLDAKAVGFLAIAGIAITVVLATVADWGRVWWIPVTGSVEASLCAVGVLFPRGFDPGPRAGAFYDRFGGATPVDAAAHMVAEWDAAYEANRGPILWKTRWLTACIMLSAGTFVVAAVSFYLWR